MEGWQVNEKDMEELRVRFEELNNQSAGQLSTWALDALDALHSKDYARAQSIYKAIHNAAEILEANAYALFVNDFVQE